MNYYYKDDMNYDLNMKNEKYMISFRANDWEKNRKIAIITKSLIICVVFIKLYIIANKYDI